MTSLSGMVGVRKERGEKKKRKREKKSQKRAETGGGSPHAQSERPWRRSTFGSQKLQLCALDYVDGCPLAQESFTARNAQCISVSFVILRLAHWLLKFQSHRTMAVWKELHHVEVP